jgi:hypothetical protein
MTNAQNARDFDLQLKKSLDLADEEIEAVIQVIGMTALKGVVLKTPVDTGRARGNWIVTKGQPSNQTFKKVDKAGGPTIQKGNDQIQSYDHQKHNQIIIQNNLPYANRLENGWSKQAPQGMVALTLNEVMQQFREVIIGFQGQGTIR